MNYSIYSLCWHDNFAIFHALKVMQILRLILVILSIACGSLRGKGRAGCFHFPMIFCSPKKQWTKFVNIS